MITGLYRSIKEGDVLSLYKALVASVYLESFLFYSGFYYPLYFAGQGTPAPIVDEAMSARIMREVIEPTLAGMRADGRPYRGFLYAGLMIGADGVPKVLEFNCRFGDPETQPIMMRLKTDLVAACLDLLDGRAAGVELEFDPRAALGVVGLGDSVSEAQARAYARVDTIHWDGMVCRRDIGYRAVARERGC